MAELSVTLCGQTTTIACAPEDEARLNHLIGMISQRAENARAIVGDHDRWRQMLFTAIFLADELDGGEGSGASTARPAAAGTGDEAAIAGRLAALAERMHAALDGLETAAGRT